MAMSAMTDERACSYASRIDTACPTRFGTLCDPALRLQALFDGPLSFNKFRPSRTESSSFRSMVQISPAQCPCSISPLEGLDVLVVWPDELLDEGKPVQAETTALYPTSVPEITCC